MSRILFEFFDGEQTLVVVGIPSAEAFGTPEIDAGDELLVSGIPSAEAFGTPKIIKHPRVITQISVGSSGGGSGAYDPTALFFHTDPHILDGTSVETELVIVPTAGLEPESRRETAKRNLRRLLCDEDVAAVPDNLWELFDDHTYPIRLAYSAVWLWMRVHRAGGLQRAEVRRRAGVDAEQERAFWAMVDAVEEAARARAEADRARAAADHARFAADLAVAVAAAEVSRAAKEVARAAKETTRAAKETTRAVKEAARAAEDVSRAARALQESLRTRPPPPDAAPESIGPTSNFVPLLVGAIVVYGVWTWVSRPAQPPKAKAKAKAKAKVKTQVRAKARAKTKAKVRAKAPKKLTAGKVAPKKLTAGKAPKKAPRAARGRASGATLQA